MSIFGSLTTAVLGLTAQSRALGHISDNIANAQTLGYKRVNTSFETLVLESSGRLHSPGGLTVKPVFVNNIQGALQQVQSPTNVSIQGAGMFSVSKLSTSATGPGQIGETVQTQTGTLNADNVFYTRVGDFELDKNRYLVNSAGFALNGWMYDSTTGQLNKDVIQPIQVNTLIDKPTSTKQIDYSANLPATPTAGVKIPTSSIQVFDTQGNARTVNLNWRQQGDNDWRLFVTAPDSSKKPLDGSYPGGTTTISFGPNQAGTTALPQINTLTFSGGISNYQDQLRVGEVFKTTIDGKDYELEITNENIGLIRNFAGVANAMANVINSASPSAPVLAMVSENVVSLIARTPGKAFELSTDVTGKAPVTNAFGAPAVTASTPTAGEIYRTSMLQTQIDIGDSFSVTVDDTDDNVVNGRTFSITVTAQNFASYKNAAGALEALSNKINAAGLDVVASTNGSQITLQRKTAGMNFDRAPAFSVTNADSTPSSMASANEQFNTPGVRQSQQVTLIGNPGDVGAEFTVSINGAPVSYTTTGDESSMEEIAAALAAKINRESTLPVTAAATGGVITLTAKVASTKPVNNSIDVTAGGQTSDTNATVDFSGDQIDIGDIYTVNFEGIPFEIKITKENYYKYNTQEKLSSGFADIINARFMNDNNMRVTGGTSGNTSANIDFTGGNTDVGDVYTIRYNGLDYSLPINDGNQATYLTPTAVLNELGGQIQAANPTATFSVSTFSLEGRQYTRMTILEGSGFPSTIQASVTNGAIASASSGTLTIDASSSTKFPVGLTADMSTSVFEATDVSFSLQQTTVAGQTPAHIGLNFGTTPETVGTLTSISTAFVGTNGTATTSATQTAGRPALVTFSVNYGFGEQQITLNLGNFGQPGGVTQYAGREINVTQFVQDGAPRGQFKDVVFNDVGEVLVNYDNGRSKQVARVPVVSFNDPNKLQRQAGGVFIETQDSGKPNFNDAGNNGSGAIIANSVEGSNVDIADEFTKLIVTQRTYSANTKIVTTSDEMLQEVLNLKR